MKKGGRSSKKSSLRFACDKQINLIEGWREMSPSEFEATWFLKREYDSIKLENDVTAKSPTPSEDFVEFSMNAFHSKRGIEKLLDSRYHFEKRKNKRLLYEAVLVEQSRQRLLKKDNPQLIRNVSKTFTKGSKTIARKRAMEDAAFMYSLMEEDDESSYTSSVHSYEEDTMTKNSLVRTSHNPAHSGSKRVQSAVILSPSSRIDSIPILDMRVIEQTQSSTGIDVELYDGTCPRNALLYASNVSKDLDSKRKIQDKKKKTTFKETLQFIRCGAFELPHLGLNRCRGVGTVDDECIIKNIDGKQFWSSQNQRYVISK